MRPPAVADRLLPSHASLGLDHLDVLIALAGRGARGCARHRGGARRDDDCHRRVGLALRDGLIDRLAIIGAVGGYRRDLARDLAEQRTDLGGIALLIGCQLGGKDLAGAGINREVELAPGPGAALAVLRDQPFAGAVNLQARGVDHHVHLAARLGLRQRRG